MFDRSLLNPMLTGPELYNALKVMPRYDESIRSCDKSLRLVALSDLYNIYLPSQMSEEIYTKIYLSTVRSLNKKETIDAVRQSNENFKMIKQVSCQGIIGGSDSFTIIGCSGIGKSTAISRSLDLISDKTYIEVNGVKICPIMIVQCPFDASVKGLALEILRKTDCVLGTKYYSNAIRAHATTDILIGIISQVSLFHIGLLIIDEIQNVAITKNGKSFIQAVTQLINNSGISICMVGTPECKPFFEQKLQLARRSLGLYYKRLQYDVYYVKFCKTIYNYQYTQNKSEISEGIVEWLYEHSGGIVSLVVSLLHDAQEIAILSGYEKIDLNSLYEAFEKRTNMLHEYMKNGIITLPQTGKVQKKHGQATLEKVPTLVNEAMPNGLSEKFTIVELLEQSKKNGYDIVEILKRYFAVEELNKEGCKLC